MQERNNLKESFASQEKNPCKQVDSNDL
jgi:hypothetical protein